MGAKESKVEYVDREVVRTVYRDPVPEVKPEMKPWRNVDFTTAEEKFKKDIQKHKDTRLNIVLIGHTGAGKSSLINSIYSISRGSIIDIATSKSDDLAGVGTHHFDEFPSTDEDMFTNIHIFDTMGFTGKYDTFNDGISDADLKAVCEGRIKDQHKFNSGKVSSDPIKENVPTCVVIVVSAEALDNLGDGKTETTIRAKMENIHRLVPHGSAKIAIITKADRVCGETSNDIRNMFKSEKIYNLVRKATSVFGMEVNKVFPIVNFTEEMEVASEKSIPILFALKFALNFAADRNKLALSKQK